MGQKGSNSTVQTNAPNPVAMAAYQDVINRATTAANKPYVGYSGETVAPINAQQTLGIGNINANAGFAQPYVTAGGANVAAAATPINANDIATYMDPYINQVIQATQADFDTQNARANSTVTGNAAAQGALGGDRVGVAQALTQEAQNRVQAPVIAGLRSAGYNQAVSTAQQEKLRQGQMGVGQANIGVSGQNAALTGANAQIGAGTLQQQTQQAQDTAAQQEFFRQQGYDFQTAQYLASIVGSMGSMMGGTSTTQGSSPNPWAQVAGLGLTAAGMFLKDGGAVEDYAEGGMPYSGVAGYVPTVGNLARINTMPQGVKPSEQKSLDYSGMAKGLGAIGNKLKGMFDGPMDISSPEGGFTPSRVGDFGSSGIAVPSFGGNYIYRHGGGVHGYAPGGDVENLEDLPPFNSRPVMAGFGAGSVLPFEDRWSGVPSNTVVNPRDFPAIEGFQGYGGERALEDERATGWNAGFREPPPSVPLSPERPAMSYAPTVGVAADATPPVAPMGNIDTTQTGVTPLPRPRPTASAQPPVYDQPSGVAAAPPSPTERKLLGLFSMSPELRQGMIAAGLSMMANRHGGPGSFLAATGEGGLAGVGAYNKAVSDAAESERADQKMKLEREKFERPYSQMTVAEKLAEERAKINEAFRRAQEERAARREDRSETNQNLILNPLLALPEDVQAAMREGKHGKEFLDTIKDPGLRNIVESIGNYEQSPTTGLSKLKGRGELVMAVVKQFNPDYDDSWYKNKAQTLKNFYANTAPNSPVVQARAYNTAVGHAGELAEAIMKLHAVQPAIIEAAQKSGLPIVTYLAQNAGNWLARGTGSEAAEALNTIRAIAPLYVAETTKFYSGSSGAQAEKEEIGAPLKPNLSVPELIGAIRTQMHMFKSKTEPMEQEFREATEFPGMKEFGTKKNVREWHVTKDKAKKSLDRIEEIYGQVRPPKKTPPPGAISGKRKDGTPVWKLPDGRVVPQE